MKDKAQIFFNRIERFSKVRRGIVNSALAFKLSYRGLITLAVSMLLLCGWLPNAFLNLLLYVAAAAYLIFLLLFFTRKFEKFESHLHEAFKMEALMKSLNSRLISALDFMRQELDNPLTRHVLERAEKDLENDFESCLDQQDKKNELKRMLLSLCGAVLIAALVGKEVMGNFNSSWTSVYDQLFPVKYSVSPGPNKNHIFKLNEKVEIKITFNRDSIEKSTLVLQSGEEDFKRIPLEIANKTAAYTLSYIESKTIQAYFEFAGRATEKTTLIFTTNPVLENMQTELIYPSYTRILPKSLEGIQQRIIGLTGTRVTFGLSYSKEIANATISWDDGSEDLGLDVVGRFASISLMHTRSRMATLRVEDIHGLKAEEPLVIVFDVQKDERPSLKLPRFLKKDMPMKINAAKLFSFGVRVRDDFGVQRCVLRWQKASTDNPSAITEKGEIERLITPPSRKTTVNFAKPFSSFAFKPGDKIIFQIQAYDNHRPKAQSTKSSPRSFFIFKDALDNWQLKNAGFGLKKMLSKVRINKVKREETVKNPPGLRNKEVFQNKFKSKLTNKTEAATTRGKHKKATSDYFRLLTEMVNDGQEDE